MEFQQKMDLEEKLANRDAISVVMESMVTFVNFFTAIGGNILICSTIYIQIPSPALNVKPVHRLFSCVRCSYIYVGISFHDHCASDGSLAIQQGRL